MKIIVITSPEPNNNECDKIVSLLENGIDYIHIRRPQGSIAEIRKLIKQIPSQFHNKLKLHSHFKLLNEFDLAGIHLNSHTTEAPFAVKNISKSCHSIDEILTHSHNYDYVTLSPIFDSISKAGYKSAFNITSLKQINTNRHIVALGGITPQHRLELEKANFWGMALLGYIWNNNCDFSQILTKISTLK